MSAVPEPAAASASDTPFGVHDETPREDHIIVLDGMIWEDYERLLHARGARRSPRIAFHAGALELMAPSRYHEALKSWIGCLLEAWCLDRGVDFGPYGSWTLEDRARQVGLEPDECYIFGPAGERVRPDLAVEVIWTSGGIGKLAIYRELEVDEVWTWRQGAITVSVLEDGEYRPRPRSRRFPDLDLELLVSFLDRPTASQAIREYRAALQAKP